MCWTPSQGTSFVFSFSIVFSPCYIVLLRDTVFTHLKYKRPICEWTSKLEKVFLKNYVRNRVQVEIIYKMCYLSSLQEDLKQESGLLCPSAVISTVF